MAASIAISLASASKPTSLKALITAFKDTKPDLLGP